MPGNFVIWVRCASSNVADQVLAALIRHDRRLGPLCTPIGERHLAVTAGHEPAFRRALHALGYALPV
ncbi:hypothetical protein [Rhizomonospora bruguierae]|uniref:hypothetical protein n=1 Tax=Rhizomonospora bruguierae TaxID=1581705 RepID=UPI001BD0766C|nr:hypothetical protein [Micromonospora sp. NBRC 107566]